GWGLFTIISMPRPRSWQRPRGTKRTGGPSLAGAAPALAASGTYLMTVYRPKILACLALLAVIIAFFAGGVLLRPRAASAASKPRQFVFGPMHMRDIQQLLVEYANTTHRTAPTWNVGVFAPDGSLLASRAVDP